MKTARLFWYIASCAALITFGSVELWRTQTRAVPPPAEHVTHNADGSWDVPANSALGPLLTDVARFEFYDGSSCTTVRGENRKLLSLHCKRAP